jgi:HlyD family secretion protein
MNWKRIIVVLVVVGALLTGGYVIYQRSQAQAAEAAAAAVETETAVEAQANEFVLAEGMVRPLRDVDLSFQTGGRVAEILVAAGDTVQAGDVLIQLEATSLENARDQAAAEVMVAEAGVAAAQARLLAAEAAVETTQTAVTEAEAQLALLLAGPRPEAVAAAQFEVAAAQAGVGQAAANRDAALQIPESQILAAQANVAAAAGQLRAIQDEYDAILNNCFEVTLPDGNTETVCPQYGGVEEAKRAELEQAQLQSQAAQAALDALLVGPTTGQRGTASGGVAVAQANQALAEAQLALAQAGPTEEQIEQAEIGVEVASTAVTQAQNAIAQAEAGITQAEAALLLSQASLQAAEVALARMTLRAPFEGTVAAVNAEVGELLVPGTAVVSLADLAGWLVETTDLTELDVVNIAPGDVVKIQIDAIPDASLRGTIQDIDSVATPSRGDVTYAVTIQLEDTADLPLRWGMTVFVEVDQSS